ncbi:hypothetical protein [Streptomyces sp. NPDC089919]|uniref:hypothetical protein n=1 Tax=Streptomyces sp. NPDC089919 TaxID=3155188 RepID=UPI00343128E2
MTAEAPPEAGKSGETPLTMLTELEHGRQELESLCHALTGHPAGDQLTVPRPVLAPPEYGFYSTTNWLSSWLAEAWTTSFTFLFDQARVVGVDSAAAGGFPYTLDRLRTRFAHNLDLGVPRDRETQAACYEWFKRSCGSAVPSGAQWEPCLAALLEAAVQYVAVAIEITRAIEQHPDAETLIGRWRTKLGRSGVVYDYLAVLERAAGDLGLLGLDLRDVRDRYRRRWDQSLALVPAAADVDEVTLRQMEQTLLAESGRVLPVTAGQVMERLRLTPGADVAAALRLGQVLYVLNPSQDRTALLDAIVLNWGRMAPDR